MSSKEIKSILRIRRNPMARKLGKQLEVSGKRLLNRLALWLVGDKEMASLSDVRDIEKIIIVRPNFRIGNTVISASLIPAVKNCFPDATIDFLAAENTACLLENMGLRKIHTISRSHTYNILSSLKYLFQWRQEKYDLAIDGSLGSFTAAWLNWMIGTRYRAGVTSEWTDVFSNIHLPIETQGHAYEVQTGFNRCFSSVTDPLPRYVVSDEEMNRADRLLSEFGIKSRSDSRHRFLAVCIAGKDEKKWNDDMWLELIQKLAALSIPLLIFYGSDELDRIDKIKQLNLSNVFPVTPQPLRAVAALLQKSRLVVTPDSGPMHLAGAVNSKVLVLVQAQISVNYIPQSENVSHLMFPTVAEVIKAVYFRLNLE